MELAVYNQQGQDTGRRVNLNDEVFAIEPNEHALYLDVKQYLANRRQGTHKSKERSDLSVADVFSVPVPVTTASSSTRSSKTSHVAPLCRSRQLPARLSWSTP